MEKNPVTYENDTAITSALAIVTGPVNSISIIKRTSPKRKR